ncbi:MAG: serine--tRNA ligase [Bacteroidota bacterium]|nr:serine--tRNA ligase [Bacteroidota bacterium]
MLFPDRIRNQTKELSELLTVRNKDFSELLKKAEEKDAERKQLKTEYDNIAAESNKTAKLIGQLYKEGKQQEAGQAKQKATDLKNDLKGLNEKLKTVKDELTELLLDIPNIPHPSVPAGKTDEDNELIRTGGPEIKDFEGKPHWDLAVDYDIIDFEAGNKITGAGFPVFKGKGAKLQRALINFFLREAEKEGYTEIVPPLMVNEASGLGTGQLPDKEGQMYEMKEDKLYMIPTAEVPLTNLYRDTIIKEDELPIKMCGYSACFRREAGSYGKDVRGLNRLHQFDKIEIVQIARPEMSYKTLDDMVSYVEGLLVKLELPYRIVRLCGGDLGFTSALTFDFEVWSAGQQKWLEVSSVSNFESFQANRLKLRYKGNDNKGTQIPHTLNGSALALPRIIAALLENNQTDTGITIPEVLREFTGFQKI